LRSQGATIPIIAITANANTSEHERCAEAGMDAVLVRPILLDTIDRIVRKLVDGMVESDRPAIMPMDLAHGPLPAKVHALMQQTLRQSLEAMGTSLDQGDLQSVRNHLHALRGSFAMIREMETADRVRQMEVLASADDRESLKTAMRVFAEHASSVLGRRSAMPDR